jgi:hypothetical protein
VLKAQQADHVARSRDLPGILENEKTSIPAIAAAVSASSSLMFFSDPLKIRLPTMNCFQNVPRKRAKGSGRNRPEIGHSR